MTRRSLFAAIAGIFAGKAAVGAFPKGRHFTFSNQRSWNEIVAGPRSIAEDALLKERCREYFFRFYAYGKGERFSSPEEMNRTPRMDGATILKFSPKILNISNA